MSKFIKELQASQNKSLFSYLCENLNVKEYNKLNAEELKHVNACFASFTKQGAIDLVAEYMKDTLQNSYYITSSLDELIVIKKMCQHHGIKFSDTLTPEHQLKFSIFEHLGGWLEKYKADIDESHMAASQCAVVFDDDFSFSQHIVNETFAEQPLEDQQKLIGSLVSLLTKKKTTNKELYYKNITSRLGDKEKEQLCDYYIQNYDEFFANFFEIHKNELIGAYFSKSKNEIKYFCILMKNGDLVPSYSLSWHQTNDEFKLKTKKMKDWITSNLSEIHKKDKLAVGGFVNILIRNSFETSNDPLSTYSFDLLKELLLEIKNKDVGIFNAMKTGAMQSFTKYLKEKQSSSKMSIDEADKLLMLSEKLMLGIDLLDNKNASAQSVKKLKETYKI